MLIPFYILCFNTWIEALQWRPFLISKSVVHDNNRMGHPDQHVTAVGQDKPDRADHGGEKPGQEEVQHGHGHHLAVVGVNSGLGHYGKGKTLCDAIDGEK